MGHENWPWPAQGSLKWGQKWWPTAKPRGSIAARVRSVELLGDVVVLGAIGFLAFKVFYNRTTDAYKTKGSALVGHPPALIAQDFDFSSPSANRTLSRERLQEYKTELANARKTGSTGSEIAFKY